MRASGAAAAVAVTGLAGCSGILGGSSEAAQWQYDPGTLSSTQARFFGSMQYGNLYDMRNELPPSMQESFEVEAAEGSSLSPGDLDLFTGVGGGQIDIESSSGAFFGSVAITGSFDAETIESEYQSNDQVEPAGDHEGYTLYEGTNLGESVPGDTVPGQQNMDASAAVGISDDAVVVGVIADQTGSVDVEGTETVTTMVDAKAGNSALLTDNSDHAQSLQNQLGGASMVVGAEVDGALVEAFQQQSGGAGMGSQALNGLRAGGFNADIGSSTTSYKFALVYSDGSAAEESGITGMVDMVQQQFTQQPGINSVNSNRNGNVVTVTVKGDTETLLSQGQNQVPMGGQFGSALPVDY